MSLEVCVVDGHEKDGMGSHGRRRRAGCREGRVIVMVLFEPPPAVAGYSRHHHTCHHQHPHTRHRQHCSVAVVVVVDSLTSSNLLGVRRLHHHVALLFPVLPICCHLSPPGAHVFSVQHLCSVVGFLNEMLANLSLLSTFEQNAKRRFTNALIRLI